MSIFPSSHPAMNCKLAVESETETAVARLNFSAMRLSPPTNSERRWHANELDLPKMNMDRTNTSFKLSQQKRLLVALEEECDLGISEISCGPELNDFVFS